jgi:hypothetical protein
VPADLRCAALRLPYMYFHSCGWSSSSFHSSSLTFRENDHTFFLGASFTSFLPCSFVPIVLLALVFNCINVIGFTYAFVPHRYVSLSPATHIYVVIETRSKSGLAMSYHQDGAWASVVRSLQGLYETVSEEYLADHSTIHVQSGRQSMNTVGRQMTKQNKR